MRNQIVVLAGGKGTRMGSGDVPKVLVMLKDKPLILYLLHEIEKINQLAKPVVVVGYKAKEVMGVLGDSYIYAIQHEQLGTADAVKIALPKVSGENILVLYGDMPFIKAESLKQLIQKHFDAQANISMLTAQTPSLEREYESLAQFGRIKRGNEGKITGIIEAKDASAADLKITEVNPGIYMFNVNWLKGNIGKIRNNNTQAEYYLTDIVGIAISGGENIQTLGINPKEIIGINNPDDLIRAEKLLETPKF
jgi:bifunctional UDP-N-acetylglucosamine pyrophosphorylase/glucosamine-1-phosphate N-acetyltransferase